MPHLAYIRPGLALLIALGCSSTVSTVSPPAHDGAADLGEACTSLPQQYAAAFAAARTCSPNLAVVQCGHTASTSLQCPRCVVPVNDTTALDQIRALWDATSCPRAPCLAIACIAPGSGACIATDGGGPGMCTSVYPD